MAGVVHGQTVTGEQTFSSEHVKRIVRALGIDVEQETSHDFLLLCPFHNNSDTPSLSLSKSNGRFICFNPSCYERGTILDIVKHVKKFNDLEALRYVINVRPSEVDKLEDQLSEILAVKEDFDVFDPMVIKRLADGMPGSAGEKYMTGRGFDEETLRDFSVGYSDKNGMVTVPVYSHNGVPVGLIGRSVEGKRFKNSVGLPSSRVFFNLNRAMRKSSTAIVVEASFDAMKIHQAGFPNVIATIGGHVSPYKYELLNRYFTEVIVMTDNDKTQYNNGLCRPCGGVCRGHNPGRELGMSIANNFHRSVSWAVWSESEVFPHGAKDAGDLTGEEIRKMINNSVTDVEYRMERVV